jgi:hypothetical protein
MYIVLPDRGVNTSINENDPVAAQANRTALLAPYAGTATSSTTSAQNHITRLKALTNVDPFGRTRRKVPGPG